MKELTKLSLKQKVGQLFFIGLSGTTINKESELLLENVSPGGICLFARNIRSSEQVRLLLDNILEVLPIKPLISIDEEGGLVDRLRRITTPLPSAGFIQTVEEAERLAEITAQLLLMLGFNMNFAPVVDLIDDRRGNSSNGLYSRGFGKSKEHSLELVRAYLEVLQRTGCLGCVKHFPGLGASETDSHEELPLVKLTREELFANDLFAYRELFKTSLVYSVMVGHASYPMLDLQETDVNGKLLPSSLSFNVINVLLRHELGYQGLVITDDMEMGAILKNYGIGDACKMAINAGADMLLICADSDLINEGFKTVLEAVEDGEIKEERIDESLKRISNIKTLTQQPLVFDVDQLQSLSRKTAELNEKINYNYGG